MKQSSKQFFSSFFPTSHYFPIFLKLLCCWKACWAMWLLHQKRFSRFFLLSLNIFIFYLLNDIPVYIRAYDFYSIGFQVQPGIFFSGSVVLFTLSLKIPDKVDRYLIITIIKIEYLLFQRIHNAFVYTDIWSSSSDRSVSQKKKPNMHACQVYFILINIIKLNCTLI